jgi:hypothetical protein
MRDHREGQDPTPTDITDRIRQISERIQRMPATVRRTPSHRAPRVTHTGRISPGRTTAAARFLRGQR